MVAVLADTHTAFWHLGEPHRLSANARAALAQALALGDPIYVASITVVEARYLVERSRINQAAFDRLIDALAQPGQGFTLVTLDLPISLAVERIGRAAVPDMPDRIIAATGLHLGIPVVTADRQIRSAGIATIW